MGRCGVVYVLLWTVLFLEREVVMEQERVRIADIARELGVSTATVSNVLHGKTKKISDETVKRVQELIEERNYIPNMAGILLAQNSSRIMGVVINDHPKYEGHVLEDGFIASSVNALSLEMERNGYFMMVKMTRQWNEIVRIASMWNMEGLILIGFCDQDYKSLREKMHIPFVVYDGFFPDTEKICNITIDHYDGGHQAGAYLKSMGHEKVVCITDNVVCMDEERLEGCRAGMAPQGVDYLLVPQTREERRVYYQQHMEEICRYTAVFAVSDFYAAELIYYARKWGKRVPEDLSVIGFDDNLFSNPSYLELTTIRQDAGLRARTAIRTLLDMRQGICEQKRILLPVKLVERSTVRKV